MRKILFAAVAVISLLACNNTKKYEAPIEALSTQWDQTTAKVADFATMIAQEMANAEIMTGGVQPVADIVTDDSDEITREMAELGGLLLEEKAKIKAVNVEVNDFVKVWSERTESLTGLKDGLAGGNLGAETETTIAELQTAIADAGLKMADWTERLSAAKKKMTNTAKERGRVLGVGVSARN